MTQGSLFSTRFTFGLAAYLIGATALVFATPLEICPSVILPGGGKPVRVKDGVVRFTSTGLWGRALGERKRIVVSDLVGPIPDPYVNSIARNGFGTTELKPLRVKFGPFDFKVSRPERSQEARKEVVAWLKRRLREAGFADDRFFIRRDEIELEIQSDREIGRRKQYEQTVRLY